MSRYLAKAFPCCFKMETEIIQDNQEVNDIRQTEIEIKKRFREQEIQKSKNLRSQGLRNFTAQETAGRFSKKLKDQRRPKIVKYVNQNVDDFNSVIFNKKVYE